MQKTRQTHTVLPCVKHVVVFGDDMFSVAQCEGETAGTENTMHAAPTAPTNSRAQNIVPCEKWQLGHCAALDHLDLMPWNI